MNKEQIIEAIKAMTIMEINELVEACEAEFGVSAAAPVAAAGSAAFSDPSAPPREDGLDRIGEFHERQDRRFTTVAAELLELSYRALLYKIKEYGLGDA